jgi:hypothetical protein
VLATGAAVPIVACPCTVNAVASGRTAPAAGAATATVNPVPPGRVVVAALAESASSPATPQRAAPAFNPRLMAPLPGFGARWISHLRHIAFVAISAIGRLAHFTICYKTTKIF